MVLSMWATGKQSLAFPRARGSVAAAARLITIIEDGGAGAEMVMDGIFPRTKGAYRIGFTGPPGAGKSSLVYRISRLLRAKGKEIGIIAVDPTLR